MLKKIKKPKEEVPDEPETLEDREDLFESKFVKEIIETYEDVMALMDAQEAELDRFIQEDPYEDDGPQVHKAKLKASPEVL